MLINSQASGLASTEYSDCRNIEELTQDLNHVQIELDNYMLENEELRERLGMDPKEQLDSRTIKKKKQVKEEQTLALNRVLTKEV